SAFNTLEDHQETHQPQKRSPASSPALYSEDLEADSGLEDPMDDMDKKNTLFRFGKRQGPCSDTASVRALFSSSEREARSCDTENLGVPWSDMSAAETPTLFRLGKRSDLEEIFRDALAREELSNSPWYMENEQVKRGGFHWGQKSEK
ncbi:antho-RFamide neuropeptides-like isoform X2, partial [Biomphalaria pfeifferi]